MKTLDNAIKAIFGENTPVTITDYYKSGAGKYTGRKIEYKGVRFEVQHITFDGQYLFGASASDLFTYNGIDEYKIKSELLVKTYGNVFWGEYLSEKGAEKKAKIYSILEKYKQIIDETTGAEGEVSAYVKAKLEESYLDKIKSYEDQIEKLQQSKREFEDKIAKLHEVNN